MINFKDFDAIHRFTYVEKTLSFWLNPWDRPNEINGNLRWKNCLTFFSLDFNQIQGDVCNNTSISVNVSMKLSSSLLHLAEINY